MSDEEGLGGCSRLACDDDFGSRKSPLAPSTLLVLVPEVIPFLTMLWSLLAEWGSRDSMAWSYVLVCSDEVDASAVLCLRGPVGMKGWG